MAFATTFGCFYVYLDDAAVHCFLRLFFGTAKTNAGTNAGPFGTAKTNAGTNAGPVARIFHVFRYSTDFVISASAIRFNNTKIGCYLKHYKDLEEFSFES